MVKGSGIILGKKNLESAIMKGGKPEVITNAEGERAIPFVVVSIKKEIN